MPKALVWKNPDSDPTSDMYLVRRWSVRNARALELLYQGFEGVLRILHPLWLLIGYQRIERPVRVVERFIKEVLFDCRMCGHCLLGETGMSCPMNCPKELRNGPCGGVREDGGCEVVPAMCCVWIDAWTGSRHMRDGSGIFQVQSALENTRRGHSSWLREARLTKMSLSLGKDIHQ